MGYDFLLALGETERSREAAEKLKDILSSQEFHSKKSLGILDYIAGLLKGIAEWVQQLVKRIEAPADGFLNSASGLKPGTISFLKIVGAVIVIALIFIVIFFIAKNLKSSRRLAEKEDYELLAVLRDSQEAALKATDYCRRDDIRQGVRFLYLAYLLRLSETNIIRIDKSKTNKQYINEARENGYMQIGDLESFTSVFNWCWYGGRAAGMQVFDQCMNLYRSVAAANRR